MDRQKLRDAALVLPAAGLVLIMPPFAGLFVGGTVLGGVPAVVLYIFGVWAGLIALGVGLSRRLGRAERLAIEDAAAEMEAEAAETGDADR